jgi:assimilatory nitrate reductase electron transfer subunit
MTRTLSLSDPVGRRAVEVVVEGDQLVAATCVGAGALAADLVVACEHGTPVPTDPAHLLVRGGGAALPESSNPTHIPDDATVCRCNGVTKRAIVGAWHDGARTAPACAAATRAGTGCGGCAGAVTGILDWLARVDPDTPPSQAVARTGESDVSCTKHPASVGETRAS